MENLKIALPKGRLGDDTLKLLGKCGLDTKDVLTKSRTLMFKRGNIEYLICKPSDVPIYVEKGVADIGIVGKDTIEEEGRNIFELMDLEFGKCHFSFAMENEVIEKEKKLGNYIDGKFPLNKYNHKRVGTKFTAVCENYLKERGLQMELIKLHGNIELAPKVGLVDMIMDIVSTGTTLRENNLSEVCEVMECSARLISNAVCFRVKNKDINNLMEKINSVLREFKSELEE